MNICVNIYANGIFYSYVNVTFIVRVIVMSIVKLIVKLIVRC